MKKFALLIVFAFFIFLVPIQFAEAFIVINEFLADPPPGELGDVNGDGVRSSSDDEFIEIVNFGDAEISLSDWYISDSVSVRHVFTIGITLLPYECILIFGGGMPTGFDVQTTIASSGGLSLNNSGDSIQLFDNNGLLIDSVLFGAEGGQDQSLSRYPDGSGSWYLHSLIPDANGAFYSPGRRTNGQPFSSAAIPEPASVLLLGMGFGWYFLKKNQRRELSNA